MIPDYSNWIFVSGVADPVKVHPGDRRFVVSAPVAADANRRERRALVKALGHRQFKKLYRGAQA